MNRQAVPFPIAPGKTEADLRAVSAYLADHMDEYRESRQRLGVLVERVYLQSTPMGNVAIAYVEGERDFPATMAGMAASNLEIDRRFLEMSAEVSGVDVRQPPPGPPPETVGQWMDEAVTTRKRGLGFIAPLLPGKIEAGKAFCREAFVERREELTESRRGWGENVEVVTLNSTPMGDFVCAYLEGDDPVRANREFAASQRPYDAWFKARLKELFPPEVDFSKPIPPVTQLWDYVATAAVRR